MRVLEGGIAFFDSGIGGLTVLAECWKRPLGSLFYYYGDNARAPYGNLPPKKIKEYVKEAFDIFQSLRVKVAVLACNTATAVCVEELRRNYDFPVIGIEPAILPAVKKGGEIFVLSTRATYESARFHLLCARAQKLYPNAIIRPFACEQLAGEIERRVLERDFDASAFLPKGNPRAVVLGCTHYIFIKEQIRRFYNCEVYDGNEGVAKRLETTVAHFACVSPSFSENSPACGIETNACFSSFNKQIYFLGDRKQTNLSFFEQMFGIPYK